MSNRTERDEFGMCRQDEEVGTQRGGEVAGSKLVREQPGTRGYVERV